MKDTGHFGGKPVTTATSALPEATVPTVTPMVPTVSDPFAVTTIQEARDAGAVPGTMLAAPLAPATGAIDVPAESLVVVTAKKLVDTPTFRIALTTVSVAFALFLGYVADQILQTRWPLPWYLDVLVVLTSAGAVGSIVYFWRATVLVKVRRSIAAGLVAFTTYVITVIIGNNGLDGIDWNKTFHAGLNAALVVAAGGLLILVKVFDNNPTVGKDKQ